MEVTAPASIAGKYAVKEANFTPQLLDTGPIDGDLLLADEPTANLDSENGEMLLKMMRRLRDEHDMTFVFSTHDPLVVSYASRVVTLRDGKIVSDERKTSGEPAKNAEGLTDAAN